MRDYTLLLAQIMPLIIQFTAFVFLPGGHTSPWRVHWHTFKDIVRTVRCYSTKTVVVQAAPVSRDTFECQKKTRTGGAAPDGSVSHRRGLE